MIVLIVRNWYDTQIRNMTFLAFYEVLRFIKYYTLQDIFMVVLYI
jgi:hypothetical protein